MVNHLIINKDTTTIFEVHKQYNLRSKRNDDQTKKTTQNQPKKTKEAHVSKILQILPRQNPYPSGPTIVDITSDQPSADQPSTSIPLENPHKEIPSKEKENNPNQIPATKTQNLQTEKSSLPFNLGAEIEKLKILVPLTELIKNEP